MDEMYTNDIEKRIEYQKQLREQLVEFEEITNIANMTNKEAAAVIKKSLIVLATARANGKSMRDTVLSIALMKAVAALEKTPDEKEQKSRNVNCRNLYSSNPAEGYAAAVNLLAVECLVKRDDPEGYGRYINIFYKLTDEDLDELDFRLGLNRHISTVGAMITQGDYDSLIEDLIEYLEEKEKEK